MNCDAQDARPEDESELAAMPHFPRQIGGFKVVSGQVHYHRPGPHGAPVDYIPTNLVPSPSTVAKGAQFTLTISIGFCTGTGDDPATVPVDLTFEDDDGNPVQVNGAGTKNVPTNTKSLDVTCTAPNTAGDLFIRATKNSGCMGEAVNTITVE